MNRRKLFGISMLGITMMGFGLMGFGEAASVKISGFIDTSYNVNFNKPLSRTNGYRSYDANEGTILLNNAQVTFEGELSEGVGFVVEPNFGSDAGVNTSAGMGTADDFDIQEAYLTYGLSNAPLEFKAGKFATLQGFEVIETADNHVISRGYLYGLAEAFTHVGAMATVKAPAIVSLSLGAINGWDLATDNNRDKSLISRLGLDFGRVGGGFVFYYGIEKAAGSSDARYSFDSTWGARLGEKVNLAWQVNFGQEEHSSLVDGGMSHWVGATLQPKVQFTELLSLGTRYEWFQNLDGDRATDPNAARGLVLQNISAAPGFQLTDSILVRLEYRYDWASEPAFEDKNGLFRKGHQSTFTTQLVYSF